MAKVDSHFDVLVVGAGLSGIAASYYLQSSCPEKSFAVLEGRSALGGTWDLFRYPGIRSDSDMHTLGFSFYPWPDPQAIADGPSILKYLHDTAAEFSLDEHIRFDTLVERVEWSTDDACWTVYARDTRRGDELVFTTSFLWACTGYYRYERGYTPDFPGVEEFEGDVVHPQFWTDDIDYDDKRVVVIGSGATAVTLVPEMAKRAAHVTMLQRSPSYVVSIPETDLIAERMTRFLGAGLGASATRWKNILRMMLFFQLSRRFPRQAAKLLVGEVRRELGDAVDAHPHFTPTYAPWDQRICFVPDGDLFDALRSGRASVVTDHVDRFTSSGIRLRSGEELDADLVVTATGLELVIAGGADVIVDGEPVDFGSTTMYKGAMLSGLPNAAISVGYTNASWTLKCELISEFVCRLLHYMDEHGYDVVTPRLPVDETAAEPLIDFESGYIQRALETLPNQGARIPWKLYQNYILDRVLYRRFPLDDGALHFEGKSS